MGTEGEAAPLELAARRAIDYLASLPERHVGATAGAGELLDLLGGPLPDRPTEATATVELLSEAAERGGVVASSGPRYFGFVVGGTLPAALAADWLVSAWDQNNALFDHGPAVAVVEHVAAAWLVDLLGLPPGTSVGFPTGCTMAHLTALAAARHQVLAKAGWDVERHGLQGAPEVTVIAGAQRHLTLDLALGYVGLGADRARIVPADDQGRMRVDALADALAGRDGPTIVCAQVGDVNTGAIDPVGQVVDLAHRHGAWVHVDGAFGLWAAASPALRPLLAGVERADSWACDAHKLLNVPYDCGLVFVADPAAHRGAMQSARAEYLPDAVDGARDPMEWVPELSRRARSVPVWAALRTLGRSGVAELVERCCAMARRFAEQLAALPDVEVLNEVVLNQVLARFGDDDAVTKDVIARVQAGGAAWFGGTSWAGRTAMRISVSSWRTGPDDVDRAVAAIRAALAAATRAG
jgi:glutamate/tyrosine decarboxylase-like PLP-dependent enzyme